MLNLWFDDPAAPAPRVLTDWDEASCTQLVYLYTEVARNFGGDAKRFFHIARKPRGGQAGETLNIASVDVGGGTTDLIINSYRVEGAGTSVTLFPEQKFREGFNVAGDDILRAVAESLRATAPSGAELGRLGGEEFVLILSAADEARAIAVADTLRVAVGALAYWAADAIKEEYLKKPGALV